MNKKFIINLNHECQFCMVAIKLDYNNSAWKSVSEIVSHISGLLSAAQRECDQAKAMELAEKLKRFLPGLVGAQKNRDLCLIAEILETDLLPFIRDVYEETANDTMTVCKAGNIIFEKNAVGEPVLIYDDAGKRILLTGRSHPFMDAVQYFFEYRDEARTYYMLAGGCMIYEALAIMRIQIDTKVYIFEESKDVVRALREQFELDEYIEKGRISFITENILREVGRCVKEQVLLVKPSSMISAMSEDLKDAYSRYRMIMLSHKEESYLLYKNYRENCVEAGWKHISEKRAVFAGKKVYLVAGGPSLGKCFNVLRDRDKEKSVILCVGTSAGKLLKEGIDPEFVIISDPLPTMEKQLAQPFDYKKTSLIYACTAYGGAVAKYGGEKYVVFQKDFNLGEEVAREKDLALFETGGSVSTLALDIALQFEAAEVVCIGLDLAYTGNQMHVAGVDDINDVKEEETWIKVKNVSGGTVPTVQNLNSYRLWIEKRLKRYNGSTRLINISNGAYIEGMENVGI
ncbi:motility associated factor glycosyltransferase family protein [Butyrivibrio fibrisolvens]|uniref:motility associated factor glycosyltransferase family protein n=1 Tax=Butyrivibrio fibrisolvens TaxID=831 RepID=UPI0003B712AB|nr:6-hydroxymethylpterin diphosphokinase MptE-like protein [Butyrivibrio fibrisolvens]